MQVESGGLPGRVFPRTKVVPPQRPAPVRDALDTPATRRRTFRPRGMQIAPLEGCSCKRRRDERGRPAPRAPRHHQALPLGRRERQRRPHCARRRDPCRAGRERRGQEHPHEDHLRGRASRRRARAMGRRGSAHRQSRRRALSRHRHGVPAFLALRDAHGRGEHRARPRPARAARGTRPAHSRGLGTLRAAHRSGAARAQHVGGRAPARRDRALPAAGAQAPHHGRAHVGAHAAGG